MSGRSGERDSDYQRRIEKKQRAMIAKDKNKKLPVTQKRDEAGAAKFGKAWFGK